MRNLIGAADAQTAALVRRERGDVAVRKQHLAGIWLHIAADQIEQRGLARAIGAQYAQHFVRVHMEGHVVDHLQCAVAFAGVLDG